MKGILLIDKQQDWTSSDVVAKLRGILREKRIGHTGTLDPMATGLLCVFVGRATRAVEFAENHSKRYIASIRLGTTTDTEDIWGKVLSQKPAEVSESELLSALESFKGEISQIPPMYSAIKIKGQKLYKIARAGGEVERPARNITIHSLELIGQENGDYVLDISCSKGTYIRSLCRDIGEKLGCGACMSALRRIEAGNFKIENAYTLSQVQQAADRGEADKLLLPMDSLFESYPACTVSPADEKLIRCGNAPVSKLSGGEYRVYSQSGEFLALCRQNKGKLETLKSFFEV